MANMTEDFREFEDTGYPPYLSDLVPSISSLQKLKGIQNRRNFQMIHIW